MSDEQVGQSSARIMSENNTRHVESETDACRVQLRCPCGETVTAKGEQGAEIDLSTECDGCGRRHVVTITEVRGVAGSAPPTER